MSAKRNGYALVLVLIGVALLALLVESALLISGRAVRASSEDAARANLDAAARAGVTEGILSLVDQRPGFRWPTDGTPRLIRFNGVTVQVAIADEAGKVDLNGAPRPIIFALFEAAGLDRTAADAMADRVSDWREPGDLKRLNGAKAPEYRAAGLPYGPRDGPFQSINELNLVLGMTPTLYAALAPGITVDSVLPMPELQTAPPIALLATGMDAATVESIMAARARGEVAPNTGGMAQNAARIPGQPFSVFTITADAQAGAQRVIRSETIRFTGNQADPFWVLAVR